MKQKQRFLLPLLMAIVMMAMSPTKVWALEEYECNHLRCSYVYLGNEKHLKKCDTQCCQDLGVFDCKGVADNVGQSSFMKDMDEWINPEDEYTPVIENNMQQMAEMQFTWTADGGSGEGGGSGDEKVVELDVTALQVALERICQVCDLQFYTLTFAYSYSGNDEGTSVCTGINLYRDGDSYDFIIAPTTAGNTIMAPANCSYLFANADLVTAIDFTNFNTSNVTDMSSMFACCENLTSLTIGNFDMSSVINNDVTKGIADMFKNCYILSTLTMKSLPYLYAGTFSTQFSGEGKTVNVVLDDNSVVYIPTAEKPNSLPAVTTAPTYTRTMTSQWGTLVVPFDVVLIDGQQPFCCYKITSITDDQLTLKKLSGTLRANTPVLVRMNSDVLGQADNLSLQASNCTLKAVKEVKPVTIGADDSYSLAGTYAKLEPASSDYFISNNSFWSVGYMLGKYPTAHVAVSPFRAYIKSTATSEAKQLVIGAYDDETTGINQIENGTLYMVNGTCYNLNGQRLTAPRRGLNIINGKKILVK